MDEPISNAFAPLEQRVDAMGVADRISLGDYEVDVEIGAFAVERDLVQKLRFNVVVEVANPAVNLDDDVDLILSYDTLAEAITTALASERLNLLETLADKITDLILQNQLAQRVFLRIEKLDRGPYRLGVEVVRDRISSAKRETQPQFGHVLPTLVYLSENVLGDKIFSNDINALIAKNTPLVFCLGLSAKQITTAPKAVGTAANTQINLLSVNQNAWAFASRDDTLSVVETMTELSWCIKNNKSAVWAPAKMLRDATNPPDQPDDGMTLALWLAEKLGAKKMIVAQSADDAMGVQLPSADFPIEQIILG